MEIVEIQTLIDITKTGIIRLGQGSELEINQHKNWTTLRQCLELRSNIIFENNPKCEEMEIKNQGFGTHYKGKHKVWSFRFYPDRSGCYLDDNGDPVGLIYNDLHEIPIIEKLQETINISKAIFDLKDQQYKNTIIKAISGTD